ncbi:unnamed protein product [Paramecium octaurelia]|uniref:Transmembrane protein n=1 Tax=Paramecium octaurelia TaxID=43137 RepID=A0A8S1YAC9_PAROT|nr:unnamed protein product [Paramecium octaurelia]
MYFQYKSYLYRFVNSIFNNQTRTIFSKVHKWYENLINFNLWRVKIKQNHFISCSKGRIDPFQTWLLQNQFLHLSGDNNSWFVLKEVITNDSGIEFDFVVVLAQLFVRILCLIDMSCRIFLFGFDLDFKIIQTLYALILVILVESQGNQKYLFWTYHSVMIQIYLQFQVLIPLQKIINIFIINSMQSVKMKKVIQILLKSTIFQVKQQSSQLICINY